MKRAFILFVIPFLLLLGPAMAQDDATTSTTVVTSGTGSTAAAIAAKQAGDEGYKRIAADLQAVQADNEELHAKITAMEQEIQTLRDAQAHAADSSGIQDELKRLAQSIQEVDKKRLEDKDAISEEIHKSIAGLEKAVGSTPSPTRVSPPRPAVQDTPLSDKGYSYTIKDGDTLGEIVHAYNKEYKSKGVKPISIRQAKEANPTVDWGRLKVGQVIVIPKPDGA